MRITFLEGVYATPDRGTVVDIAPGEFLDELGIVENSASTECADKAAKMEGLGFILAQYQPGATSKELRDLDPASSTEILAYDVDNITREALDAAWPTWARFDAAVYSTMKHTADAPRVRLMVRLSRPVANGAGDEYVRVYHAVAHLLGIPFDASTKDRARFFFAPQHMPGRLAEQWRFRFRGDAVPVEAVLAAVASGELPAAPVVAPRGTNGHAAGPLRLPVKKSLGDIARRLLRSSDAATVATGAVLEAVLAGKPYAKSGGIHLAGRDLAFTLARDVPLFDGDGFADKYLAKCWEGMDGAGVDERLRNWQSQVDSAVGKLEAGKAAAATATAVGARYAPASLGELTDAQEAAAGALEGALVNAHRNNFYVWDARAVRYVGPVAPTGLAAACRECLSGVPNFAYQDYGQGGKPTLKSGPRLVEEYGFRVNKVNYWAVPPARPFDLESKSLHAPAYICNRWSPRFHQCADELLRAIGGDSYWRLEAYLAAFPDLTIALPALLLHGARGTWKSRIAEILSRFWGIREAANASDATQVLGRFSGPLLDNPVVHSDEVMARTDQGKAIPEIYRTSISSPVHKVEMKGIDPIILHAQLRHVISVNHLDQVFGGEVDLASVEATLERYLVFKHDKDVIDAFEARWAGTAEIVALREGTPLLEHVAHIAATSTYVPTCRFWVATGTDPETVMRARFSDDLLVTLGSIAVGALLDEPSVSNPGALHRLPLVLDEDGQLRLSPARLAGLWTNHTLVVGSNLKRPTAAKAGQLLTKAGFKLRVDERAVNSRKWKAWEVDHETLKQFLEVEGEHTWDEIGNACFAIWGRRPK